MMFFRNGLVWGAALIFIVFMLILTSHPAHAAVIDSLHYAADGNADGSEINPVVSFNFPNYGTFFQPTQTVDVSQISVNVCAANGGTYPTSIDVYHLDSEPSTIDFGGGTFQNEGRFPIVVPPCPTDGSATSTYPAAVVSDTLSEPMRLNAGAWYMFFPNQGIEFSNTYDFAHAPWIWGTSILLRPDELGICSPDFSAYCGSLLAYQADRTSAPAFDLSTYATPVVLPCDITHLDVCFENSLAFVFTPPAGSFDRFITLKDDIKDHAPFGYFSSAVASLNSLEGSTSPAFVIATSSPFTTYIFLPLRTGLTWLIGFASLIWLYKRLTHVVV